MNETGFLNIYKEKGYTSHDVVAIVRKLLSRVKTGHTGTLDPQAEGVLPVCVGRATKFAGLLTEARKTYVAECVLGVVTDTGDVSGTVLSRKPTRFDLAAIRHTVQAFEGEYWQTPPMYSAIKVNGKKLYELARQGITVARQARPVQIERIDITAFAEERGVFTMEVTCSKGTYIRTLCTDIGESLGCGACMGTLTRTQAGFFYLRDAVKLEVLKQGVSAGRLKEYFIPLERVLPYARVSLKPECVKLAVNGNRLPLDSVMVPYAFQAGEKVWLYGNEAAIGLFRAETVVALTDARTDTGYLLPEVMLV